MGELMINDPEPRRQKELKRHEALAAARAHPRYVVPQATNKELIYYELLWWASLAWVVLVVGRLDWMFEWVALATTDYYHFYERNARGGAGASLMGRLNMFAFRVFLTIYAAIAVLIEFTRADLDAAETELKELRQLWKL